MLWCSSSAEGIGQSLPELGRSFGANTMKILWNSLFLCFLQYNLPLWRFSDPQSQWELRLRFSFPALGWDKLYRWCYPNLHGPSKESTRARKRPEGFISYLHLARWCLHSLFQLLYEKSSLDLWILYKGWSAPQVKEYSNHLSPGMENTQGTIRIFKNGSKASNNICLSSPIFYFLNYLALGWHTLGSQFSVPQALQCIYFFMPRSCLVAQAESLLPLLNS